MSTINVQGSGNKVTGDKINKKITISIGSVIIIAVAIFIFFFNSNNISENRIENSIIATWQCREESDIFITFEKDGIAIMKDGDIYIDGTYSFFDDNKIQLNAPYMEVDLGFSGNINIQHDILTITNISAADDNINMMSDSLTFDLVE